MLVEFGQANLLQKARQQPDKVKQVIEKVKTDGLLPTIDAVRSKLDQPIALGYCNVGRVVGIGAQMAQAEFRMGDRVVSNAPHAEIVSAARNLCARVPENVSDETAAFAVLGAIALQGIRLLQPTIGEAFAVTGLGLIGTDGSADPEGARVPGDWHRLRLIKMRAGSAVRCRDGRPLQRGRTCRYRGGVLAGQGMDGVLITASTASDEPVHQAATMCRKRGRIVLVGVVGLQLSRADFYEKEISFQVSCSYGPGRYDADYEQKGNDYPIGFVRWTEQRNFEAVLDLMADGKLDVTLETALVYGRTARELRKRGNLLGANDLWIASRALQHHMTLVTANLSHFHKVPGLQLLGY